MSAASKKEDETKNIIESNKKFSVKADDMPSITNTKQTKKKEKLKMTNHDKNIKTKPQEQLPVSGRSMNSKLKMEDKSKSIPIKKDSSSSQQNSLSNEPMKIDLNTESSIKLNIPSKDEHETLLISSSSNNNSNNKKKQQQKINNRENKESKSKEEMTKPKTKKKNKSKKTKTESETTKDSGNEGLPAEVRNFKRAFQRDITPKKIFADGRRIPPTHLLAQKPNNSSVNVYMFEEFLSDKECDGLRNAHNKYVELGSKTDPILCFDGIQTLREHLKHAGKSHINVTPLDFTEGTMCVNKTFSTKLKSWLRSRWNYNTEFYPRESRFSEIFEKRIEQAMGLRPENGGKFQITSYPSGIGYKKHTDCQPGSDDKRDKMATVLVYLETVTEGGEIRFPELGIWVRPRKGRALVWNNMNKKGQCEDLSQHLADPVKTGSKYILQRWYYYENFYSIGKRPPSPPLPHRDENQSRVTCDQLDDGSCRWFDQWNYDHLIRYRSMGKKILI
ncbi:uncharacterized protein LOC115215919 [Argonauta hians]